MQNSAMVQRNNNNKYSTFNIQHSTLNDLLKWHDAHISADILFTFHNRGVDAKFKCQTDPVFIEVKGPVPTF